jgi:uncharacterized membrane protein
MELVFICFLTLVVLPLVLLTTGIPRAALGLLFLLFMPGYTFVAAMLPRKASLNPIQRLALGLGLSIAIVAFIGFVLNYTPWRIQVSSVAVAVALFIVICSAIALYRRRRLPESDRYAIRLHLGLSGRKGSSKADKMLSIVLVISALAAIGLLAYSLSLPKEGEKFTAFSALGSNGVAGKYDLAAVQGGEVRVTLEVVNHEQEDVSYNIEVTIDGEKVQEVGPINLSHTSRWKGEVTFVALKAGKGQKVEFLLFKDDGSKAYRETHLWLDVQEAG